MSIPVNMTADSGNRALSLNKPLGMICAGLEARRRAHILLLGAARFALGGEELAQHLVQPLLEQVALSFEKL